MRRDELLSYEDSVLDVAMPEAGVSMLTYQFPSLLIICAEMIIIILTVMIVANYITNH